MLASRAERKEFVSSCVEFLRGRQFQNHHRAKSTSAAMRQRRVTFLCVFWKRLVSWGFAVVCAALNAIIRVPAYEGLWDGAEGSGTCRGSEIRHYIQIVIRA
jgi:hypothetical protein